MASAVLETINGFLGNRARFTDGVFKFTNLDSRVQKHLARVYSTLGVAMAIAALGCYAHIAYGVGGVATQLVSLGSLMGLAFLNANDPHTLYQRYGCLAAFSFCSGAALGPITNLALILNPGVILSAFLSTCAVFTCFTVSALITQRRTYMFLGGYLASAVMAFMVLRLSAWLTGSLNSTAVFNLELYGGLLMFSAYILYDTQLIVEKAHAGDFDHVRHALDLLVDVLAVFVRILVVLLKRAEDKRREEERKKRRS